MAIMNVDDSNLHADSAQVSQPS